MEKVFAYDHLGNKIYTEINIDDVYSIHADILSGDEVLLITLKNGRRVGFDSGYPFREGDIRCAGYDVDIYNVSDWTKRFPYNNSSRRN